MSAPRRVTNINPGAYGFLPSSLTLVGDTLFFVANDGSSGTELWKTDGTTPATRVSDINPGVSSSSPYFLTAVGNTLFFIANDGSSGRELWKTDGITPTLVSDINPGALSSYFSTEGSSPLTAVGNTLFFAHSFGSSTFTLWKSDGTTTTRISDSSNNLALDGFSPFSLAAVGNTLFFAASDGSSGIELWKTDGTNTARVRDINPGVSSSTPSSLTAVGNTLFFAANDGSSGTELWKTDGTNTTRVRDINPGADGSNPSSLTAAGNTLFFVANDGSSGIELWKTNGTTATLVSDINPGVNNSSPSFLTAVGNTLFFVANDGSSGTELWKTDGTTATLVSDINPGADGSNPSSLTAVGNTLFFVANDGSSGYELWKTDGTTATLVSDINPGVYSSSPSSLTAVGSTLFFSANDGSNGNQLWALDLPPNAPATTAAISAVTDNVGLIQGSVAAAGLTDDTTPTITGSISAALAAGETLRLFNGATLLGSATVTNTTWTFTPAAPLTPGAYSITARVADAAGNLAVPSAPRTFTLDSTPPTTTAAITAVTDNVGLIQGSVAAAGLTDDTTPTITGSISAALAAGETLRLFNGATLLGNATVDNTARTWSFTPASPLPATPGTTYSITARVADAAGNLGTASPARSFNLATFVSSNVSTTLVSDQTTLVLTGTNRINGAGNSLDNSITGNESNNRIIGGLGRDILTGGGGATDSDTFVYNALNESLLGRNDVITDFNSRDRILTPFSVETATLTASAGSIQAFSVEAISGLLSTSTFAANTASAFTVTGVAGTAIALNDSRAGFQMDSDALIFLQGFSISSTNAVELI